LHPAYRLARHFFNAFCLFLCLGEFVEVAVFCAMNSTQLDMIHPTTPPPCHFWWKPAALISSAFLQKKASLCEGVAQIY